MVIASPESMAVPAGRVAAATLPCLLPLFADDGAPAPPPCKPPPLPVALAAGQALWMSRSVVLLPACKPDMASPTRPPGTLLARLAYIPGPEFDVDNCAVEPP